VINVRRGVLWTAWDDHSGRAAPCNDYPGFRTNPDSFAIFAQCGGNISILGTVAPGCVLMNGRIMMSADKRAPQYKDADRQAAYRWVLPAARARQGVTGHNVRYVLGYGLASVIIAFLIIYFVYV
jgi:hypothetical protein